MSKARSEYLKHPDSQFAKNNYIIELEQQKAELIQMIMGLSANCQYECMIPEILNKYKESE